MSHINKRYSKGSIQLDGAGSSIIEDPDSSASPYWGTLHPPRASYRNSSIAGRDTGHVDEGNGAQPITNDHQCVPEPLRLKKEERKTPKQEKRFGLADPAAWDAINRSLTQQKRLCSIITTDAPADARAGLYAGHSVGNSSRRSSQRRDLRHFTRELEKFAQAADAIGRLPVITPTISESRASYQTVKQLVPYKADFEAAGLAVTSEEQRQSSPCRESRRTPEKGKRYVKLSNQPLHVQENLEGHGWSNSSGSGMSSYCISDSRVQGTSSALRKLPPSPSVPPPHLKKKHKHTFQSSQRLLSSLLKRLSNKTDHDQEPDPLHQTQHVNNGQVEPRSILSPQHERKRLQPRSQRPQMQMAPETEQTLARTLPIDYVIGKRGATVALSPTHDPHFHQHRSPSVDLCDTTQSVGNQAAKDLNRTFPPKPCLEPIGTIEEETEFCPVPDAREATHSALTHRETKPDAALNSHRPRAEECPWIDSRSSSDHSIHDSIGIHHSGSARQKGGSHTILGTRMSKVKECPWVPDDNSSDHSIHDDVKSQRPVIAKQKGISHTVLDSNKPRIEECSWVTSSSSSNHTPPRDTPGRTCASPKQKENSPALVDKSKPASDFCPWIPIDNTCSQSQPFEAKLGASRAPSSLRVLDEEARKMDEEEHLKDTAAETCQDDLTQIGTSHTIPPSSPKRASQHGISQRGLPRLPRPGERFIYVKRTMPAVSKCHPDLTKPLPPEPFRGTQKAPRKRPISKSPRHIRPGSGLSRESSRRDRNAVAELAKAEEMLQDLDVFLNDHDDASIADRDVLKGLQVAIQAAADDLFDAYIRHKTGLRIRRFLADLKSFDEEQQTKATDQRAREKRAKQRRR
ncbi:hypothetical protein GGR57DRAFT_512004 [Xylariaceae sp. FL1272]|nr:hypothetical protein GGR57DRAFT_512004 [Xylariaceae sp. FL1272]